MARATVVINNIEYNIPELDFNALCDLSDLGVDVINMNSDMGNPLKLTRGIVAWITGKDLKTAGKLLEEHIANGGEFDGIYEVFTNAISESGFFKALQRRAVIPEDHKKKTRKATTDEKTA